MALCVLSGGLSLQSAAAETAPSPPADVVSGAWQHHKVTFAYIGFTAFFTCSGLENHVRQILVHFGARNDAMVTATGCPGPIDTPSGSAWVDADFYTLAAVDGPAGPDSVKARWTPLKCRRGGLSSWAGAIANSCRQ